MIGLRESDAYDTYPADRFLHPPKPSKGSQKRWRKMWRKQQHFSPLSTWSTYQEYIHSVQWFTLRRRILAQRGNKCERCGWKKGLHVHHLTYVRLGHELDSDLKVLCYDCHRIVHHQKGRKQGRS